MLNTLHLAFGFYLLGMCASLRASITKAKHAVMCSVGFLLFWYKGLVLA